VGLLRSHPGYLRPLVLAALGVVVIAAAVGGWFIVNPHAPGCSPYVAGAISPCGSSWSRTLYNVALTAIWAGLIIGALLVAIGLVTAAWRDDDVAAVGPLKREVPR
jgi:hypothetical protein